MRATRWCMAVMFWLVSAGCSGNRVASDADDSVSVGSDEPVASDITSRIAPPCRFRRGGHDA